MFYILDMDRQTNIADKRQDTATRVLFSKVLNDLMIILPCYHKSSYYDVITLYLKAFKLFDDRPSIKGRILYILDVEG